MSSGDIASPRRFSRAILDHGARLSTIEKKDEVSVPLPFFCSWGSSGHSDFNWLFSEARGNDRRSQLWKWLARAAEKCSKFYESRLNCYVGRDLVVCGNTLIKVLIKTS